MEPQMIKPVLIALSLTVATSAYAAPEKSWWDNFKESIVGTEETQDAKQAKSHEDSGEQRSEKNKEPKEAKRTQLNAQEKARLQAWLSANNADQQRKGKGLPKGLQKKLDRGGELPPGWKRKIQAGDKLTNEEYEQAVRIPDSIRAEIKIPEDVVEIIRVGDQAATVIREGREVIDIIRGL